MKNFKDALRYLKALNLKMIKRPIRDWLRSLDSTTPIPLDLKNKKVTDNILLQCAKCYRDISEREFLQGYKTCPYCAYHYRLNPQERISFVFDNHSFEELFSHYTTKDPILFPNYLKKIQDHQEQSSSYEAIVTGKAKIYGMPCYVAVMNFYFIGGSMGVVVGEKLCQLIALAIKNKKPIIIFTASGGARMQEGIFSLMQMASVSSMLAKLDEAKQLCVTILTDPTYGGVTASFAMLGDIILSEPMAMIGFSGPRIIEGIIKKKLPDNFQTAEFLLKQGFIDKIVDRFHLRNFLSFLIKAHKKKGSLWMKT